MAKKKTIKKAADESYKQVPKEFDELAALIYTNQTIIKPDYIAGMYEYWARIDAIEKVLIRKGILTHDEVMKEMVPIIKAMKEDFK